MNTNQLEIIHTIENGVYQVWTYSEKIGHYIQLDERYFCKTLPIYGSLNEKARKQARKQHIKGAKVIKEIWIPAHIPNITKKAFRKYPPSAQAALLLFSIFDGNRAGCLLTADILCGQHATALRKAEPEFYPVISIQCGSPNMIHFVSSHIKNLFPPISKHICHKGKLKRKHILDYRTKVGEFPHHIQDYSLGVVKIKHQKKFTFPVSYTDCSIAIIGADNAQIREATPYIENAAIILLNSASGDLAPTKLSTSDIAAYDPAIVEHLNAERHHIASLLRWWWNLFDDEDAWARQIVQTARASFGKPDSRYIRVELDPKKLRDAIRYQVLLSFFDEVEKARFMTSEELAPYRQTAKEVFDPAPPEPVRLRHAEDPDVFLEIMKAMVKNPPAAIVAENERFVKKDKPLAAWRTIGGERYLVFLEDTWTRAYAKLVKAHKDIESSYLQHERWERDFQKLLCEQSLIKAASSGYRYRYDLMGDGTRDNTYVVAIPAHLLET